MEGLKCWSLLLHDKPTNAKIRNWEGWRLLQCHFWNNRTTRCAVDCRSFQLHRVWVGALGLFFSPDNLCLSVWLPLISGSSQTQGTQRFISAPHSWLGLTLCQPLCPFWNPIHSIDFNDCSLLKLPWTLFILKLPERIQVNKYYLSFSDNINICETSLCSKKTFSG